MVVIRSIRYKQGDILIQLPFTLVMPNYNMQCKYNWVENKIAYIGLNVFFAFRLETIHFGINFRNLG